MKQPPSCRYLSEFSTFGIGGPIRYFREVSSFEEMEEAFRFAKEMGIPYLILGKGSNCLFDDRGFDGLVILNKIDFCKFSETQVHVGSGYSFSLLGIQTARKGLSGLEFSSGIPATVGGAVFMNAGANGKETCDCLHSVTYLHEDGSKKEYRKEEILFSYRTSSFQTMKGAILAAVFQLNPYLNARKDQLKILDLRLKTQPYKEKSAGCVFRNPLPSFSAGALIDRCGLKGFTLGGAKVSELHANFIVNSGSACAQDVVRLIRIIQERVFAQTGIHLEPEIRIFLNE
ncbi:MAG: UDP-N-acetylmuramate dehydrogenase [Chlamydiota bacterium]